MSIIIIHVGGQGGHLLDSGHRSDPPRNKYLLVTFYEDNMSPWNFSFKDLLVFLERNVPCLIVCCSFRFLVANSSRDLPSCANCDRNEKTAMFFCNTCGKTFISCCCCCAVYSRMPRSIPFFSLTTTN